MNRVEIALNKNREAIYLILSIIIVVVAISVIVLSANIVAVIIGGVAICLAIALAYLGLKTLMDKKYGLMIDEKGIFENSHKSSIGLLLWSDIVGVGQAVTENGTYVVPIHLADNRKYLDRAHGAKKESLEQLMHAHGTPAVVDQKNLKCDIASLEQYLHNGIGVYKV